MSIDTKISTLFCEEGINPTFEVKLKETRSSPFLPFYWPFSLCSHRSYPFHSEVVKKRVNSKASYFRAPMGLQARRS